MSRDKRAEIVEAMARAMCHAVHPCKSMVAEIMADATYLRGREGDAAALTLAGQFRIEAEAALDIALKAAAEIAEDFSWQLPLYESHEANEASDDAACAACEQIAAAILALTSKGMKG